MEWLQNTRAKCRLVSAEAADGGQHSASVYELREQPCCAKCSNGLADNLISVCWSQISLEHIVTSIFAKKTSILLVYLHIIYVLYTHLLHSFDTAR